MNFIPVMKAQVVSSLTIKMLKLQLKTSVVAVVAYDLLFLFSPNSSYQSFTLMKD